MKEALRRLLGAKLLARRRYLLEYGEWRKRAYAAPSPNAIKREVIRRHAQAGTFVETGTYLGETTEFASSFSAKVISLEPDLALFQRAKRRLRNHPNIELVNGSSEEVFAGLVTRLRGDLTFWLDGHYSGEGTFNGDGPTPIVAELDAVSNHLQEWGAVTVLVDDVRCFGTGGYPPLSSLVAWAEQNRMTWEIEHDIFIMRKDAGRRTTSSGPVPDQNR